MMPKILLIEDQSHIRKRFLEGLQAKGFGVIEAGNGRAGIQLAREQLPDLIISSVMLPEIDGYSILTTLRQNPATAVIPFILLNTEINQTDFRRAMELGASDYLVKPCSVEELTRAIATQLKKRTVIQQWYATQSQPDIRSDSDQLSTNHTKSVASQSFFPAHSQLDEAFYFIEANYHKPITLSDVAQAVGYSAAYLTSLTRKQTGQTIQRWIIERRMAAARTLLLNTDQNVEEIANQVGYLHVVHFFRQFRQFHGTTPQNWRSANRAKVRASDQEVFI